MRPSDWHLEFSIDDNSLPLDLTIYGAIHQHEMRKGNGFSPSLIWQGVYDIKFKKVSGPAPVPDGSYLRDHTLVTRIHLSFQVGTTCQREAVQLAHPYRPYQRMRHTQKFCVCFEFSTNSTYLLMSELHINHRLSRRHLSTTSSPLS
jgi:hypothetical protein